MKITSENIESLPISDYEKGLLKALLIDIEEFNSLAPHPIYIDYIDYHTEYSPERTDPCPDYFGFYRIYSPDCEDFLGIEMNVDDLDISLCLLHNYITYFK